MRPRLHVRTSTLGLLLLLGAALFLSGAAGYWRWITLGGYLLAVGAWWALVRPPLTTRHVRWPTRRRVTSPASRPNPTPPGEDPHAQ